MSDTLIRDFTIQKGADLTIGFDISPLGDIDGGELIWKVANTVNSDPILVYKLSQGEINVQNEIAYIEISSLDTLETDLKLYNYHELEYTDADGKIDIVSSGKMFVQPTLVGKE